MTEPLSFYFLADSAVTEIHHDLEEAAEIDPCQSKGCFRRDVKYEASDGQINALIHLSEHCVQEITV